MKIVMAIVRVLASLLLVLFGLGAIGNFMPSLSVLGELGPVLNSFFGPWIVVLSLAGAVLMVRRWRGNRGKHTLIVAGLAGVAAVGGTWVQVQQIRTAAANGVSIDIASAFLAGSQKDESLRPVTINYAAYDGRQIPLDIYPLARRADSPAPVLVYIHGGGWGGQTRKQRQADYHWFADRGYLAIAVDYSLSSDKSHTWNVVEPQLGCALAWVAANAARYGGDPLRLAIWGESAGGNLVLNVSYRANQGTLKSSCDGKLPHIDATMALYPVVDPARMYRPVDPLLGVFGRMMGDNYTGGSPEQFPGRYAAIASSTHINPAAPPTLLIVPEADHLVVPEAAFAFAAKARAAGIDTRLIKMPYAEHAFDLKSGGIGNQLVRQSMLHFLETHGLDSSSDIKKISK
ncbi:MAG: Carboxylesterase NlhH [Pseudomonadota bacterium]